MTKIRFQPASRNEIGRVLDRQFKSKVEAKADAMRAAAQGMVPAGTRVTVQHGTGRLPRPRSVVMVHERGAVLEARNGVLGRAATGQGLDVGSAR